MVKRSEEPGGVGRGENRARNGQGLEIRYKNVKETALRLGVTLPHNTSLHNDVTACVLRQLTF